MTICPKCKKDYKLISRHTACKPLPVIPAVEDVQTPAVEEKEDVQIPPGNNLLVEQIKGRITYESKWTQQQIDETVSYLIKSLTIDESKEKYPIKLDEIAKLLEYTELRKAQFLLLEHFKENLDYSLLENKDEQKKVGVGGHNKKNYVLTSTCAKQLCMLSSTKKAKSFRMYFIIIEDLLKEIIKDPTNKLADNVRKTIGISLTEKFESIKLEVDLEDKYKDKSVIYFHRVENESAEYDIYKWGITYRIGQRGDEHKKRFGNTSLVDVIDIDHLTYKQGFDLETSIRTICKKLEIYHPYENSIETLRVKKTDDINVVINYVKEQSENLKHQKATHYLPDIIMSNPPYRKESPSDYKQRMEHIMNAPIKIKTFNYLMVDNDYDDFLLVV
jgi:phage anti-repressor protein